jgi:two-component system KDP operon response regulator KdpE
MMNADRILLAGGNEDDRKDLRLSLEFDGYEVREAGTSAHPADAVDAEMPDVLILDSLPGDSMSVGAACRAARAASNVGIIVIHRDFDGASPIDLLNAGADDYVRAPYAMSELRARVRALLRRAARSSAETSHIMLHDRTINLNAHEIQGPDGRVSHLTPKEFRVLQCLVAQPNTPKTHHSLAQSVWQRDGKGEVEYMRVVIRQLRRKLEPDPDNPRYIVTERSVGYRFDMPAADAGRAYTQ